MLLLVFTYTQLKVEAIHPDIEIDIYQFVLDDKYDLHEYNCVLSTAVSGGIITDIPHIFDVPNASVTPHKVFFRKMKVVTYQL